MTIITTRRHPLKFYGVLTFIFLILFALGSIVLFASFDILKNGQHPTKDYFMPVFSFAIYFLALSLVNAYWKNSPKITIDKHNIVIGNQTLYLKDIKDITLTGKMPFRCIYRFSMEGTAILFNDGTEKILFDDMYANSYELKLFFEQVILKKQEFKPVLTNEISRNEIRFESEETFKGNQFSSLRGITLWGLIGFFIYLLFSKLPGPPSGLLIFFFAYATFWFILHSWFMHYFGLTKDYLVVRNHNFIWKVKIYRLTDIKEIVFETQGQQPNCMRVITLDFRNKLYPAGTLRDKTWLEMKERFESKGVTVRNECI